MKRIVTLSAAALTSVAFAVDIKIESLSTADTIPGEARLAFELLCHDTSLAVNDPRRGKLVDTPGLTPPILELVQEVYKQAPDGEFEQLLTIFGVLGDRHDIDSANLQPVRETLLKLWSVAETGKIGAYKQGGLFLLGHQPGKDNEDVLIKYLDEPAGAELGLEGMSRIAVIALGQIGTQRAIPAVETYIKLVNAKSFAGKDAVFARQAIIDRTTGKQPHELKDPNSGQTQQLPEKSGATAKPLASLPQQSESPRHPWLVWLAVVIAAAIGMLRFIRKPSK